MKNGKPDDGSASQITRPLKRLKIVPVYTSIVAVSGLCAFIYAMVYPPQNVPGTILFVLLAMAAELTSVERFISSHSRVSVSSIIIIASIAAIGPSGAIFAYAFAGLATGIKSFLDKKRLQKTRASVLRVTSFNAGMWATTALVAGNIYVLFGGVIGDVNQIRNLPPLVIASIFEWIVNAILLIRVISLQTGQTFREIWKRDFQWQGPVAIAGGVVGGGILALTYNTLGLLGISIVLLPILSTSYAFRLYKNNMKEYVDGLEKLNLELKDAMADLEKFNLELTSANSAIRRLNAELFQSLAKVFDMRDPYVGGHAAQVAAYAVAIAAEMGLSADRIEITRQSALLHDIGKLAIPEAILHKPGKLTEIEYQFVKKHTDIGADLLDSTEGLKHLAPFVRHHHERWDGRGYPLGLAGEEIPLEARILNVCDSVESMASDRPYHRGMSLRDITAELGRCAGSQFDPEIAEVFIKLLRQRGTNFVVNSARSVTQQYAASLIANESLTHNMFAWVLEKESVRQTVSTEGNPASS